VCVFVCVFVCVRACVRVCVCVFVRGEGHLMCPTDLTTIPGSKYTYRGLEAGIELNEKRWFVGQR